MNIKNKKKCQIFISNLIVWTSSTNLCINLRTMYDWTTLATSCRRVYYIHNVLPVFWLFISIYIQSDVSSKQICISEMHTSTFWCLCASLWCAQNDYCVRSHHEDEYEEDDAKTTKICEFVSPFRVLFTETKRKNENTPPIKWRSMRCMRVGCSSRLVGSYDMIHACDCVVSYISLCIVGAIMVLELDDFIIHHTT